MSSTSAAQYKKEKKVIEEKVSKVRQVVPTIKTNEIILALHNYDLDVERTIQAFLEGLYLNFLYIFSWGLKN